MSSIPSVFQNFSSSYTINNPLPANTGNWDFDVFFFAHPYMIGAVRTVDATEHVRWSPILNPHITGADFAEKRDYVFAQWQRYRMGYLGVTGYHDAAALTNNGLLAVAQYPQSPFYAGNIMPAPPGSQALSRVFEGWPELAKTFSQLQNMPNAYFGAARDGVYCPFKLSEVCQDWQSAKDEILTLDQPTSATLTGASSAVELREAAPADGPYGIAGSNLTTPYPLHKRSDDGIIHISGKQFASAASFTVYYRSGWEIQVAPGSVLSSFAKSSPPHDPTALSAYYAISRELKDAYPADYNDLGKIVRTIADVAGTALSTLFPSFSIPIRAAQGLVNRAFPDKAAPTQPGPTPDLLSETQKERLSKSAHRATVVMPRALKLKPRSSRRK